jgi:hypothetical protein
MSEPAQQHANRHGHTVETTDTYSCADCGNVLHVERRRVRPSPGIGAAARRVARKRARQNRKRGRR